jgi:[ribosomal protein S18]-alanine N-acetyltransferase
MTARPVAAVTLAPMGWADLPRVVAIDVSASPRPWSAGAFLGELAREDRRYLVAVSAGARSAGARANSPGGGGAGDGDAGPGVDVLGFVGAALFPDEAHVMTIAVDPPAQGRGIGARLVAGMLEEVGRAGLETVTLEVRESNIAARRLYRRAGFEDAGVRPDYYPDGEDAVIMWRRRAVEVG